MARRRKKQVKKAPAEVEDTPAEVEDAPAEEDSSLQEEDSQESSVPEEESEPNREPVQIEKVPEETEEMVADDKPEEGAEESSEDPPKQEEPITTQDEDSEKSELAVVDPAPQESETPMEEAETPIEANEVPAAQPDPVMDVKPDDSEPELMQTEETTEQPEPIKEPTEKADEGTKVEDQDAEMKEGQDSEEEEEPRSVPAMKIEKEPTVPYCYDDDSVEVPIDPEGDEDDVLIGNESPEFLKYWRAVLDNPQDFTNWTYLLQLVEQENKSPLARRAYNGFFKRYPLCYGYWKKFAEHEKRNGNLVRSQRVLERGVRAIPLSIDLWVHMIDFYINFYKGPDAGTEKIRKVYERATVASGEEFRSEKLWNKYIQWEKDNKDWNAVMILYDRVLRLPTQHYAIFFKDYKEFVMSRSPKEVLSLEEFEQLLEEVRDDAESSEKNKKKEETKESTSTTEDDEAPPGVESNDRGKPPNEKEIKSVSEKVVSSKKKIFEDTEALVTKIWTFEEGIKRPYFHAKALERTQIKNWRDYLEAEMSRGKENHRRVVLLFERCLIACALYEDFWLKYARYLVKTDPPKARDVYRRACETHLPKKPNIHLHWATFEELEGHSDVAAKILVNLQKTLPNLAMVKLRRVAIERRAGNIEAAEELLKGYVADTAKETEKCFYIRKYVWFLVKVSKNLDKARQVLKDAITRNADQVQLYKDFIGLEFSHGDEEHIAAACDLALDSEALSDDTKFQFSQRKLEYFEDFGLNAKITQKAYDDHQKLYRSHKKRLQTIPESSQPAAKKAKTELASPTSGNKIQTTGDTRQTYSAKPTTNGTYTNQVTLSAQPQPATPIQTTTQAYQQPATAGDASLYYQNYWNYQQKPEQVQQYNYSQWPQYSQQGYYQQ